MRGPQAAGLLLGEKDLLQAAWATARRITPSAGR